MPGRDKKQSPGFVAKAALGGPSPAEDACRQEQDRPDQREESFEGNPDEAKREREQPDKWKQDQDEERERPGNNEEEAPEENREQRFHITSISLAQERSTVSKAET